jgi:amino acid transporter
VFAVVNAAVLVLRRRPADHEHAHFRTPTFLPFVGVVACLYLVLPWTSGRPGAQYEIAGALLVIGVVLWGITWVHRRRTGYHLSAPVDVPYVA